MTAPDRPVGSLFDDPNETLNRCADIIRLLGNLEFEDVNEGEAIGLHWIFMDLEAALRWTSERHREQRRPKAV